MLLCVLLVYENRRAESSAIRYLQSDQTGRQSSGMNREGDAAREILTNPDDLALYLDHYKRCLLVRSWRSRGSSAGKQGKRYERHPNDIGSTDQMEQNDAVHGSAAGYEDPVTFLEGVIKKSSAFSLTEPKSLPLPLLDLHVESSSLAVHQTGADESPGSVRGDRPINDCGHCNVCVIRWLEGALRQAMASASAMIETASVAPAGDPVSAGAGKGPVSSDGLRRVTPCGQFHIPNMSISNDSVYSILGRQTANNDGADQNSDVQYNTHITRGPFVGIRLCNRFIETLFSSLIRYQKTRELTAEENCDKIVSDEDEALQASHKHSLEYFIVQAYKDTVGTEVTYGLYHKFPLMLRLLGEVALTLRQEYVLPSEGWASDLLHGIGRSDVARTMAAEVRISSCIYLHARSVLFGALLLLRL